ncbi:MAG: biotin transporter BioY [Clostridiaceae bacterium]|nr:biotin transporter BioY [Clostridiaceae bacterium]
MMIHKFNIKSMILIALFTALIAVGAFIKIPNPFFPVPFTLQGVFCAFAGLLLGSKRGACSVGLYVIMGLMGFPVFTLPSGPQYIFQSTFGFLIGFIATAYIIGKGSEISGSFTQIKAFAASYLGLFVQYLIGIVHMYVIYNFYNKSPIGFWALVSSMSLYFLKDLMLFSFVASVSPIIKKRLVSISS